MECDDVGKIDTKTSLTEHAMKMKTYFGIALALCLGVVSFTCGQPPQRHQQSTELTPQVQWFGVLSDGLAEAERTGKPILLVSAACQCAGVPGMW